MSYGHLYPVMNVYEHQTLVLNVHGTIITRYKCPLDIQRPRYSALLHRLTGIRPPFCTCKLCSRALVQFIQNTLAFWLLYMACIGEPEVWSDSCRCFIFKPFLLPDFSPVLPAWSSMRSVRSRLSVSQCTAPLWPCSSL